MKNGLFIFSLTVFFLSSCNQKETRTLNEVKKVQNAAKSSKVESGTFIQGQTVEISGPAAVYFHPDSAKLTLLEQKFGDRFFVVAEENMYDISSSRAYLSNHQVKIMETEARELHFHKADGSVTIINLNTLQYSWGLFLFNGQTEPVQIDMSNPEKQYQQYMKP